MSVAIHPFPPEWPPWTVALSDAELGSATRQIMERWLDPERDMRLPAPTLLDLLELVR